MNVIVYNSVLITCTVRLFELLLYNSLFLLYFFCDDCDDVDDGKCERIMKKWEKRERMKITVNVDIISILYMLLCIYMRNCYICVCYRLLSINVLLSRLRVNTKFAQLDIVHDFLRLLWTFLFFIKINDHPMQSILHCCLNFD